MGKHSKKRESKRKNKGKKSLKKRILTAIVVIILLIGSTGLFLLYGPWHGFRDWLITTAMTTLNHQWLATMFYSDETIQEVIDNNKVF